MYTLEAKNVNLFYGSFQALKGVNMGIDRKQVTAFIGPSGCGKSTLLRSFNRMHDLTADAKIDGKLFLDDLNLYDKKLFSNFRILNNKIFSKKYISFINYKNVFTRVI